MKEEIFNKLCTIYKKYTSDKTPTEESQICMLWDLNDPPNVLEVTKQHQDMEEIFDLEITEDTAVQIFDMNLREASEFLEELIGTDINE